MADAMSNYLENALINHIFRGTAFSQPSDIYIGLIRFYEADKVEAATSPQEVSGGSYARTLQDIATLTGTLQAMGLRKIAAR